MVLPFDQEAASTSASQSERWVGIVDDDDAVRSSLKRVLRMEGMCVETFASGEEFLERITRGEVPPIIFITAHDEIPAARLDPCAGTAGYLRKPFDMAALIALVRPWLRESATQGVAR